MNERDHVDWCYEVALIILYCRGQYVPGGWRSPLDDKHKQSFMR